MTLPPPMKCKKHLIPECPECKKTLPPLPPPMGTLHPPAVGGIYLYAYSATQVQHYARAYGAACAAAERERIAAPQQRQPLTDEQIDAVTRAQWGQLLGSMMMAHRAYARAIEKAIIGEPT